MGKNKIDIVKIQKKEKLNVTFSKKRGGLFKKAADLCRLFGANIGILVYSPAGRPYTFGYPSADAVFDRFLATTTTGKEVEEDSNNMTCSNKNKDDNQIRSKRVRGETGDFWWENMNMDELDSMEKVLAVKNAMLDLQQNVRKRLDELTSSSEASKSSSTAITALATTPITELHLDNIGFSVDELSMILNEDDGELLQNVWNGDDKFTSSTSAAVTTTYSDIPIGDMLQVASQLDEEMNVRKRIDELTSSSSAAAITNSSVENKDSCKSLEEGDDFFLSDDQITFLLNNDNFEPTSSLLATATTYNTTISEYSSLISMEGYDFRLSPY